MVPRLVFSSSQICRLSRAPTKNRVSPVAITRIPALYLQRANMVREALFDAFSSSLS